MNEGSEMTYVILVIDRNTGEVVQKETSKSLDAAQKIWNKARMNVNGLKYHLVWKEEKNEGLRSLL